MTDSNTTQNGSVDAEVVTDTVVTDVLSPRQRSVYDLHQKGHKNVEIAAALGIAAGTVSNALVTAQKRLGERTDTHSVVQDTTQMVQSIVTHQVNAITQAGESITHAIDELSKAVTIATVTETDISDHVNGVIDVLRGIVDGIDGYIDGSGLGTTE